MQTKSARTGVNAAKRRQEKLARERIWIGILAALAALFLLTLLFGAEAELPSDGPVSSEPSVTAEDVRGYFNGEATARRLEAAEKEALGD